MSGSPPIRSVLGRTLFVECPAIRVPGTVVWYNDELLISLGFVVSPRGCLTQQLSDQIIDAFSLHIPSHTHKNQKTIRLFADRYGGRGLGPCRGSARGAFHPGGDLFLKGIGHTPLFTNNPNDIYHSHGGLHMWHGLYIAVLKEVCVNLFSRPPARIAALIDQGDDTVYPSGEVLPRVVAVRSGNQLRPAHLLPRRRIGDRSQSATFIAMTKATGQLVIAPGKRGGRARPDLSATMLQVIDDHARTASEHARWRLYHGSICPSNMQIDGGLLDLAQARTNPRSPPLTPEYGLGDDAIPRTDYADRAAALRSIWNVLLRSTPEREKKRLRMAEINIEAELDSAYKRHITFQLLKAAGLKDSVAIYIQQQHPLISGKFTEVIVALSSLVNSASIGKNLCYDDRCAVVDIFGLLRGFPKAFFKCHTGKLDDIARELLAPVFRDSAQRIDCENRLNTYIANFLQAYRNLMLTVCNVSKGFYRSEKEMRVSIVERAAFENRPMELLFHDTRAETFKAVGASFRLLGDSDVVHRQIRSTISSSIRNISALMRSGEQFKYPSGEVAVQVKTINGILYGVLVTQKSMRRMLLIEVSCTLDGQSCQLELPGDPELKITQFHSLKYKYRFDGDTSWRWADGVVYSARHGSLTLRFLVRPPRPYARIEGQFQSIGITLRDGPEPFGGYTFAVPDDEEFQAIVGSMSASSTSLK